MAMFGKRFQRTISMSQISPGSNLYAEKSQAHPGINISPAELAAQKGTAAGRPLVLHDQQQLLQAAANQWEAVRASCSVQKQDMDHHHHQTVAAAANQWEAMKVCCSGVQQDQQQQKQPAAGADQWEILKSAEAMMMMIMAGQSSSTQEEEPPVDQAMATQNDQHLQMGLWPHLIMNPSAVSPPHSASFTGLIPRVDFLDSCFYCKRRLRHERDIFIYRGDAAFCTEECRQHQILSDETRSLRASKKGGGGGGGGGGGAAASETAVAA